MKDVCCTVYVEMKRKAERRAEWRENCCKAVLGLVTKKKRIIS
jgi:hypothetical protein